MKQYKTLVAMLLMSSIMFFLLSSISLTVFASEPQNELVRKIEGALDVSVFHQKEADLLIKCFDVNEEGCYAIGGRNNTIHVYDSNGTFQYGYHFNTNGTYGIAIKENNIVIYLARSDIAVEIDSTGKCVDAEKVDFSKDNVYNVINRTYKQIGDVNYYLERDVGIFNGDYSRLVKIDETGAKTVLYDVTTRGYFAGVFHYIVLGIFPIAGMIFIADKVKKEEQESDGQDSELHE